MFGVRWVDPLAIRPSNNRRRRRAPENPRCSHSSEQQVRHQRTMPCVASTRVTGVSALFSVIVFFSPDRRNRAVHTDAPKNPARPEMITSALQHSIRTFHQPANPSMWGRIHRVKLSPGRNAEILRARGLKLTLYPLLSFLQEPSLSIMQTLQ